MCVFSQLKAVQNYGMWIKEKYSLVVNFLRFRSCDFCARISCKDFYRSVWNCRSESFQIIAIQMSLKPWDHNKQPASVVATKFSVFVMQFLRCFPWSALKRKKSNDSAAATKKTVNEFGAKISVKSENKKWTRRRSLQQAFSKLPRNISAVQV